MIVEKAVQLIARQVRKGRKANRQTDRVALTFTS